LASGHIDRTGAFAAKLSPAHPLEDARCLAPRPWRLPPARGNPALYGKYVIGAAGLGTLLMVKLVAQH
jgi:hypothetical protein